MTGDVQAAEVPSSEQVKITSGSLAEKVKVAVVAVVVSSGPASMVVSGAVVSGEATDQV